MCCCCSSIRRCSRWAATPTAPTFSLRTSCSPRAASPCTRSTAAATSPITGPASSSATPSSICAACATPSGGRLGPVDFVRLMEEALIRLCGEFGVHAGRICGLTGVWCGLRSAAALRTRAVQHREGPARGRAQDRRHRHSRRARHHLARLRLQRHHRPGDFALINPCGIHRPPGDQPRQREVARSQTDVLPSLEAIAHRAARQFGQVFDEQVLAVESLDALRAQAQAARTAAPRISRRRHAAPGSRRSRTPLAEFRPRSSGCAIERPRQASRSDALHSTGIDAPAIYNPAGAPPRR